MSVDQLIAKTLLSWEEEGKVSSSEYEFFPSYSLSRLTSFRTGGSAAVLFPKTLSFAKEIFSYLNQENVPYFILGNGSNVIAKDEGYDGLILSMLKLKNMTVQGTDITAECGASVTALAALAKKHSLTGFETFYGIPGTVGGAVFMNAGAYGGECKNVLSSVTFVTPSGEICTLPPEELAMGYRTSRFETSGDLILSATFSLEKGDAHAIGARMDELMAKRSEKQPLEYPSAGSTFKRCEGRFTAQMIDEAGLKGLRVGGAMVSEKHAGFVINYDSAKSSDIFAVIDQVKKAILEKEGLAIECEVSVIE